MRDIKIANQFSFQMLRHNEIKRENRQIGLGNQKGVQQLGAGEHQERGRHRSKGRGDSKWILGIKILGIRSAGHSLYTQSPQCNTLYSTLGFSCCVFGKFSSFPHAEDQRTKVFSTKQKIKVSFPLSLRSVPISLPN